MKRKMLMDRFPGRFKQYEAAKVAGLNSGSIIDIERGRITVSEDDLSGIAAAWDRFVNENMTTNREEVMA